MTATQSARLLLIDGHALIYRAFHGMNSALTVSKTGETVSAVFGFTNTLLKSITDLEPSHIAVAFDLPGPTIRSELYPDYKAHRPPMPDELRQQISRIRQVVENFGISIYESAGYEADDVLGTLARQADAHGMHTTILSLDSDLFQLVNSSTHVLVYQGRQGDKLYDEGQVKARYSLDPIQLIDLKALQGDASDNIPGVPGIGVKSATTLLQKYSTVEEVYENLDSIIPPRIQRLLREGQAGARLGKELTTIVTDIPVTLNQEDVLWEGFDRTKLVPLFEELEFTSLIRRLDSPNKLSADLTGSSSDQEIVPDLKSADHVIQSHVVDTIEKLDALMRMIQDTKSFAFDTETTSLRPLLASLVGISIAIDGDNGFYIPVGHIEGNQLPKDVVLDALRPVFMNGGILKVAHNGQYDVSVLANDGVNVNEISFDTMLAAHLMGASKIGLKPLALEHFNVEMLPITDLIGKGVKQLTMDRVPIDRVGPYAAADAAMTFRLWQTLQSLLKEREMEEVYHSVEMSLVPVLVRMERTGVSIDLGILGEMSFGIKSQLQELEERIFYEAGDRFNINSPQQLSVVLFEKLGLPGSKRTSRGYSTDASVLDSLKDQHPIIKLLISYRELSKLVSTYIDALPGQVNPNTGRVHTSFNQTGSATGRVSSNDPNLQNIPVRTETGRKIRNAFTVADVNSILLAADYSQIELRVLAHLSEDPGLTRAFENDEDIHTATASEVLNVPISEVTPDMRRIAKMVNFGLAYGLTKFGLAQRLEITREEAGSFVDTYFDRYAGVRDYIEATKDQARSYGYVETVMGRRRYIPDIKASNRQVREAAERMAVNMPVQGTAADILKVAMVRLDDQIQRQTTEAKMILQIHDELIFEVPEAEIDQVMNWVQEIMPEAMSLKVPLKVEMKTGSSWGGLE